VRPEQEGAEPDTRQAAADTGMQGAPGMQRMQRGSMTDMMNRMDDHLQVTQRLSGDSMRAMLPQHRQLVANLLAQMDREMRAMTWRATRVGTQLSIPCARNSRVCLT
jgi:hypothetical protein